MMSEELEVQKDIRRILRKILKVLLMPYSIEPEKPVEEV